MVKHLVHLAIVGLQEELPVISWDFAFTGKSCEGVDESSDQSKLTTLVMHDSHTGAVHCVPVNNKSQTRYMSQEVLRFINFTGHGKVALRCDQEPTMLQIQKLVQRARQRLNLSTVIENAKVGDHGSNAAVEKAIDRVRNQASVYLHALSTSTALGGFCAVELLLDVPLFWNGDGTDLLQILLVADLDGCRCPLENTTTVGHLVLWSQLFPLAKLEAFLEGVDHLAKLTRGIAGHQHVIDMKDQHSFEFTCVAVVGEGALVNLLGHQLQISKSPRCFFEP